MKPFLIRTLRVPSLLLAAALQILPMARLALPAVPAGANIIIVMFRWCAGTAAALGSVQAMSGGSTRVTSPLKARATNGVPFSMRLTTAPDQSHYWTANQTPPGLEITGSGALWKLDGTPTQSGIFDVRLTAKDVRNSGGGRTVSANMVVTIVEEGAVEPIITPGTYTGLFLDSNNVAQASSGLLTIGVQESGAFKATLQNGRKKSPFAGRFTSDGYATNSITRAGMSSLTVELHLDLYGANTVTGRVVEASWISPCAARLRTTSPGTRAGQYTFIVPGADNGSVAPAGDGVGTLKIDSAGGAVVSGTLADGSRFLQRVPLSGTGEIPVYVPLYSGRGVLEGTLRVRPDSNVDLDGPLTWIRPAGPAPKFYTTGFTLDAPVAGSAFTSVGSETWFGLNVARVILTGGNLATPPTNTVTLSVGGGVAGNGPDKLTLVVTPTTGLFKGTVTQSGAKPIKFQGAVLQRQGFGSGYFLGSSEVGNVYFGP